MTTTPKIASFRPARWASLLVSSALLIMLAACASSGEEPSSLPTPEPQGSSTSEPEGDETTPGESFGPVEYDDIAPPGAVIAFGDWFTHEYIDATDGSAYIAQSRLVSFQPDESGLFDSSGTNPFDPEGPQLWKEFDRYFIKIEHRTVEPAVATVPYYQDQFQPYSSENGSTLDWQRPAQPEARDLGCSGSPSAENTVTSCIIGIAGSIFLDAPFELTSVAFIGPEFEFDPAVNPYAQNPVILQLPE